MNASPHILLSTFGSLGDLHPFMALAQALQAQGARTVLTSHPDYRAKVEAAGIAFAPCGPDMEAYSRDLGLEPAEIIQRFSRDHGFLLKRLLAPYIEDGIAALRPLARETDLVVASSYAYAAHITAWLEKRPFATVALQPAVMLSAWDPPKLREAPLYLHPRQEWQRQYNRLIFRLGAQKLAGAMKPIRALYDRYGVNAPVGLGGVFSSGLTLGLYSPLLGKVMPDFPPHSVITGFPFFDSEDGHESRLSAPLAAFLDEGPAPLVFSLGSAAVRDGTAFFRTAAKVARALDQRAVLLVGSDSPLLTEDFGPEVLSVAYAPHSLLMPRARVNIHHGGIGSTAQALRAGQPQLIVPVFGDQFDNAFRVKRLGCGLSLPFAQWRAHKAAQALRKVMAADDLSRNALSYGQSVAAEDGAQAAASRLIAYAQEGLAYGREIG